MIMLLFRLVLFAIVLAAIFYIARLIVKPSDTIRCSRCHGKGFWYDARGKEKCDWCSGSGRLPRNSGL